MDYTSYFSALIATCYMSVWLAINARIRDAYHRATGVTLDSVDR